MGLLGLGCGSAESGRTPTALEVSFDPTVSGLGVATVQAAVDTVVMRIAAESAMNVAQAKQLSELPGKTVAAKSVSFDDDKAGLGATTVQAGLEKVGTRLGALDASLATVTKSNAALGDRVQALESKIVGAASVPIVAIGGLSATDTQSALSELTTLVLAQQAKLATVETQLAALKTCPAGMITASSGCVEAKPREPITWEFATAYCGVDGRRLCSYAELQSACGAPGPDGMAVGEWTSDLTAPGEALVATFVVNGCLAFSAKTSPFEDAGGQVFLPYRCCKSL